MLAGDTSILSVYDGKIKIKKILEKDLADFLIFSFNEETKLPSISRILTIIEAQEDYFYKVYFDSGLNILCTQEHEFLTFRAKPLKAYELQIGNSIRAFSMSLHKDGHYRVHGFVNNKPKHQYVARMVWEYFNGKIPDKMILHHKDYNKLNNHISNFELVTNNLHSSIHADDRRRNHKITNIEKIVLRDKGYNLILDEQKSIIVADDIPVAGSDSGVILRSC